MDGLAVRRDATPFCVPLTKGVPLAASHRVALRRVHYVLYYMQVAVESSFQIDSYVRDRLYRISGGVLFCYLAGLFFLVLAYGYGRMHRHHRPEYLVF